MSDIYVADKIYQRRTISPGHTPEQPYAKMLYEYWDMKRGTRAYPAWRDIDLLDLWQIASCLIVKDVLDNGADFLNRYWGTQIAMRAGFDATGRTHTSIYNNQPLGPQMETYREVVSKKAPNTVYRSSSFIAGREYVVYHALNLPLGDSDEKVDHILIVVDYE
ncbi:MAG: PAS domain-containing protein [Rhodospirillales bacterium]